MIKTKPAIVAYSMNLSLGLRPVIISYNKNITCPPSKAGIGNKFINAKIKDKIAVILQNLCQSQVSENILAIEPKPPKLSEAFTYPVNICPKALICKLKNSKDLRVPAGNAAPNV